jgi:hypothetical protein
MVKDFLVFRFFLDFKSKTKKYMQAETPRFPSETTIFPKHEVFEVVVMVK